MRHITVNGKKCQLVPFGARAAEPGTVVGLVEGRLVYRVLCADGDDLILRNVRHRDIVVPIARDEVLRDFALVVGLD